MNPNRRCKGPLRAEDLDGRQLLLVNAIIDSVVAWESPGRLARATGLSFEATIDALCGLDHAGWIEVWADASLWLEPWSGRCSTGVTFTPAGASAMEIRLVEEGGDQLPRWARAGDPDPPLPRSRGIFGSYGTLALIEDDSPSPLDQIIEEEGVMAAIAMGAMAVRDEGRKRDARAASLRATLAREGRKKRRLQRFAHEPSQGVACR